MDARVRTTVVRRAVIQEVISYNPDFGFRTDAPVYVEPGSLVWVESDALVVERPDGRRTRHPGKHLEPREGDSRLAFVLGVNVAGHSDA